MPTGTFLVEDLEGLTLADSPATEWGSFLESNGLEKWGRVTDISIRLFGLSHTFPDDLDFLFLGPDGRNLEFWSDAGGGADLVNADFTISDSGASLLPDTPALPITAGTYKPSDYGTAEDASNWGLASSIVINHPAHNGAATFAAAFGGAWYDNATWAFYVRDDASGDVGSLSGWGAQFTYNIIVKTDDFNADQRSDILWRNDSGQVYFWNMNGTQINSEGGAVHAPVSTDWHIEGTGDFDADGKSDILWRQDSGQTYIWEMNGLGIKAEGGVVHAPVSNDWHIERIGDFDGDTNSDVFWRNDSGQTYIWEMNGFGVKTEGTVVHAPVPNDWHVQGIGDFNNDGNSDILWRHDSGEVYIWEMNGLGIKSEGGVAHAPVPADWHVEDIGDFNDDGKSDILWRHDSGQVYVWEMDGLGIKAEGAVAHAPVQSDWHIFSQHNFV
jgi:FG-GAP-like repeat